MAVPRGYFKVHMFDLFLASMQLTAVQSRPVPTAKTQQHSSANINTGHLQTRACCKIPVPVDNPVTFQTATAQTSKQLGIKVLALSEHRNKQKFLCHVSFFSWRICLTNLQCFGSVRCEHFSTVFSQHHRVGDKVIRNICVGKPGVGMKRHAGFQLTCAARL